MNKYRYLLPSSIGLALLALIEIVSGQTGAFNGSNAWIPISIILLVLSVIVYVIRATFKEIDERLTALEERKTE